MDPADLARRFPRLSDWESETAKPTFKQLEDFARATHTPFGYFFLAEPPVETVPIPDLRTIADRHVERPSPDMLDTIYLCQQRQEWYRDYARENNSAPLPFVGTATVEDNVSETAAIIRNALGFTVEQRRDTHTWTEALRRLIEQTDSLGVLVMVSGVVGNNTHRVLDTSEFRGFALSDPLAPLIFINGSDSKAAQMFTLAHELAHIWLGKTALSNSQAVSAPHPIIERWSNRVAAELLVPLSAFRAVYRTGEDLRASLDRIARHFKVSTLVILRRMYDAGFITRRNLAEAYDDELEHLRDVQSGSGGNFYATERSRVGRRFAFALVSSTLEGQTLYRDAFRLLSISKADTFHELARNLGIS
ncbi:MAG TPA: ImmA/IrrE family metallo-endopeptidase [Candidatus Baltobacteraceae bacterium]|nr:ImmA/IrrE family metallo-endopeptidase [Candidatus Baltobacteraceae bacterium]